MPSTPHFEKRFMSTVAFTVQTNIFFPAALISSIRHLPYQLVVRNHILDRQLGQRLNSACVSQINPSGMVASNS